MPAESSPHPGVGPREFVALVAMLMSINALGIDAMLPALGTIGDELGVASHNDRQYVVTAYMAGFGAAQLIWGPLADRFGRKPILVVALSLFVAASGLAALASTFAGLIAARFLQGTMSASTRVLALSIVRDCYAGREMAKMLSLAQMIFFAIPILAPSVGQAILALGPWRMIFYFLAAFGAVVMAWGWTRLPETLPPARRVPISVAQLVSSYRQTLTNRISLGYTLASTMSFGALLGFVASAQQIFVEVFGAGALFPVLFACVAFLMGTASFLNSRIVERFGTRRISHTALFALIGVAGLHAAVVASGYETLASFVILQGLTMTCIGLTGANFGSMAMEPVGHIAGTAASIQGFVSTLGATVIGILIGQAYDGTTLPLSIGFLLSGIAALSIVLVTERGQLFTARNATA